MAERKGIFVGFKCKPDFRTEIERAAHKNGLSQFLREAVIEHMARNGIKIDPRLAEAPSRLGKGGPKIKLKGDAAVATEKGATAIFLKNLQSDAQPGVSPRGKKKKK